MSYATKLQEMGIVESRIGDLVEAMNSLHKAISRLDNSQLLLYCKEYGLIGHLDIFCREEQVRNLAVEMYNTRLHKATKRIDFNNFPDFSDKLYHLAEQAAEAYIPGAKQLCKSLKDLRKNYELKKLPFNSLALKAQSIAKLKGNQCRTEYLYINEYINEDTCIGKVLTLWGTERTDNQGESGTGLLFVNVELEDLNATDEVIRKGLYTTLRDVGCTHEHDCCGCISQYPLRMKKLRTNNFGDTSTWVILMSWYRNI